MRHIGRFTITQRQREENPEKVSSLDNLDVVDFAFNPATKTQVIVAISEKWFDAVEDYAEIPEYEFTIDEKQAVSCRRLGVVPVEIIPEFPKKKKARKGKA